MHSALYYEQEIISKVVLDRITITISTHSKPLWVALARRTNWLSRQKRTGTWVSTAWKFQIISNILNREGLSEMISSLASDKGFILNANFEFTDSYGEKKSINVDKETLISFPVLLSPIVPPYHFWCIAAFLCVCFMSLMQYTIYSLNFPVISYSQSVNARTILVR